MGDFQSPFPQYVAYEDNEICIGFEFKRELGSNNTHIINAVFKNKSSL